MRMSLLFGVKTVVDSKGAVVNDMPGACQSCDPACPQAGESTLFIACLHLALTCT